ncbi:MAG: GGDEF domain-containing protein, partial [Gammaproteobacteria bacterium]|nr:GGDEF domain-containing protein [Gammaproteobacteria bacterium]
MTSNDQQLDFERMRILYSSMNRIFIGGALLVLFLSFIIKEHLDPDLVLFWVILTLSLYVPRYIATLLFNKKVKNKLITPDNVQVWESYWILTTVPVLASFSSLLYYPLEYTQLNIVATFLIILASGSVLAYATSIKSIAVSFFMIYIPLIIRYFTLDNQDSMVLGVFYLLFFAISTSYARSLNQNFVENIQLKINSENQALQDPLTQLWNRRGLYLHLNKIIPRAIRNKESFGIILIDVDEFKAYNDTYGHNAGDDALVNVSACIEKEARDEDLVVRYGGEEFLAVVPDTNIEKLQSVAQRIFHSIRSNTNVTISAGLAVHSP